MMFERICSAVRKGPLEHSGKMTFSLLIFLIVLGMIPRIYGLYRMPGEFYHNDGEEYRDISEQIFRGNGFSVSFYRWYEAVPAGGAKIHTDFSRPPMLPLLGAGLYFLPFDWTVSAKVMTLILSGFCIFAVFLLGREVFSSNTVGLLGAFVYTFYPYSIYHSLCWSSGNLFLFLFCLGYMFLIRWFRTRAGWIAPALCGVFFAFASLTRPQGAVFFLIFGVTGGILFLWRLPKSRRDAAGIFFRTAVFGFSGFLIFLPWMIRNYRACGIPAPVSFYGDYSFAQASSDVSYITYRYVDTPEYKEQTDRVWEAYHGEKREQLKKAGVFSLPEASPHWRRWAWEYIRENPKKMGFIVWNRILHCFRAAPNSAAVSPAVVHVLRIYFLLLLVLIACGIWHSRKNGGAMLLLVPPASALLLAIPFLMILRYRYPFFAPFASILAAYGLFCLAEKLFLKKSPSREYAGC